MTLLAIVSGLAYLMLPSIHGNNAEKLMILEHKKQSRLSFQSSQGFTERQIFNQVKANQNNQVKASQSVRSLIKSRLIKQSSQGFTERQSFNQIQGVVFISIVKWFAILNYKGKLYKLLNKVLKLNLTC